MGIEVLNVMGGEQGIQRAAEHTAAISVMVPIRSGSTSGLISRRVSCQPKPTKGVLLCPLAAAADMQKGAVLRQLMAHRWNPELSEPKRDMLPTPFRRWRAVAMLSAPDSFASVGRWPGTRPELFGCERESLWDTSRATVSAGDGSVWPTSDFFTVGQPMLKSLTLT